MKIYEQLYRPENGRMSTLSTPAGLLRAVHLIPFDGIGGVEISAKSLPPGVYGGMEFHKYFLADKTGTDRTSFQHCGPAKSVNSPRIFIRAIVWLVKFKPELIIASLWRSCVVLVLIKLFRPWTKVVVFLHFTKDVHFLPGSCRNLRKLLRC